MCVAQTCEEIIKKLAPGEPKRLAYVPSQWYHTTVLNRTHFDNVGDVHPLSANEAENVRKEAENCDGMTVRICLKGLVMSEHGRLIIPGTAPDGVLQTLRERLVRAEPSLSCAYPGSAHVKLAHLLAPLDEGQWTRFQDELTAIGDKIDCCLTFNSIHTPIGAFRLGTGT